MPTSTGYTSAPTVRAIAHTVLLPCAAFAATIAVTSLPVCVTPSATTPLSAQNMATQRRDMSTFALPVSAAVFITLSSSLPRLPSGFAMLSQRRFANTAAFMSASGMAELSPFMYCL